MAKSEIYQQLHVDIPLHGYPIVIGKNLITDEQLLRQYISSKQVLIVTNETVAPLYLSKLQNVLADIQCDCVILPDGEEHKNQSSLTTVYNTLIKNRHHRDTTLIALGGGVIGDLTGFAAATYQRGVRFIQIPSTLLAQVDASVGGKTAINHDSSKNMIGCFHQPTVVLIDLNLLLTLPRRELQAGFAEIIKYAWLVGGSFLQQVNEWLISSSLYSSMMADDGQVTNGKGLLLSDAVLAKLIGDCCQIKAGYVETDEREAGARALLNLGHTFAHALEAYTEYQRWLHGEAVAIGLYCAAVLSYQSGYLSEQHLTMMDNMLIKAKLPRRIPQDIDLEILYSFMLSDKKINNQQLRFVLMKAPGDCYLEEQITIQQLQRALRAAMTS